MSSCELRCLIGCSITFTFFRFAVFCGYEDVTKILLEKGANVDAISKNSLGISPLHSAVASNQIAISRMPFNVGADPNMKQKNGFTPLHEASQNLNFEIAKLLIGHRVNVNARLDDGRRPLEFALGKSDDPLTKGKKEKIIDLLIKHETVR